MIDSHGDKKTLVAFHPLLIQIRPGTLIDNQSFKYPLIDHWKHGK